MKVIGNGMDHQNAPEALKGFWLTFSDAVETDKTKVDGQEIYLKSQ